MAEQQLYQTTLPASDLSGAINFIKALTDKVDKLLNHCDVKKVKTIKDKSIKGVLRDTVLRINTTKPHNIDQRSKSPTNYQQEGFLKGTDGPLKNNLIPDLDLGVRYHDEQYNLFKELSNRFPGTSFLTNTKQEKDENGSWFLYRNGKKFTTIKFLNFIDKITLKYIEELKVLDVALLTPNGIEEKERDLEPIAKTCEKIVMARYLGNITSDTDFMKVEKTKLWRNHVAVILSFAALLVILRMFKLKLRLDARKKQTTNQNNSQNNSRKQIKNQTNTLFTTEFVLEVCCFIFVIYYWYCSACAFVEKFLKSP